jgi:hypothetical protein
MISKLAAQNQRLREVIESFASRSLIEGEGRGQRSSAPRIEIFTEFARQKEVRVETTEGWIDRRSAATACSDNSWFPVVPFDFEALEPTPGWRCLAAREASIRIGFNLVGTDRERIAEAVAQVEERQLRDRDFIPVFITDTTAFEIFRLRGHAFEHIPPFIAAAPRNRRAERRYYHRRLELIRAKWSLREIVDLSRD